MKTTLAALWKMDLGKADNTDKEIIYKVTTVVQATDHEMHESGDEICFQVF